MRFLFLMIVIVMAWTPFTLHAHAVITRSSLDSHIPEPNRATEVHLIFNSNIEVALSTFELVSQGDRKQALAFHKGRGRGEIVVNLPPLPTGEYAIQYKVFAADGHLTEDIVKFIIEEEK